MRKEHLNSAIRNEGGNFRNGWNCLWRLRPVHTVRHIFLSDSDFLSDIGKKLIQHPMRSEMKFGIRIEVGAVCQCPHITVEAMKSERK